MTKAMRLSTKHPRTNFPGTMIFFSLILLALSTLSYSQTAQNWPQFRGEGAKGIAEGYVLPLHWDTQQDVNIKWKKAIPGLGHSSPVIWGDRVFVTTAVRDDGKESYLRVGLYGESPDNPEDVIHHFRIYCLDKNTGDIVWEKTSYSGVPRVMRHIKSSHATSSPATDGDHVVAFFASEGLYCYDIEGSLLWQKDLGYLDAGAFDAPEIRWGFGSSPIIYQNKVITLCDVNNQSFMAAFDVDTGEEIWRTLREEVPTWGTPTIVHVDGKTQVVVNGWHRRAGYDMETGEEIWWMDGGGDIPVPTPFVAHDLIFFSSAHGRQRPLFAIRPDARGDISLLGDETTNESVVWSNLRRGAYISTPIVYGDYLYVLQGNGALTCYQAVTGEQVYRERAGSVRGSYSASLIVGDGKLYCTSETGDIHVIGAGSEYTHLATNKMAEICMATPAVSGSTLFIRTQKTLYAIEDAGETVERVDAEVEEEAFERKAFTPPAGEFSDPLEILKITDAAVKAVQSVQYDISVEGTGGIKAYFPGGRAKVLAIGLMDGWPARFIVEAEGPQPGSAEAVNIVGGGDGDRYYVIDSANKKVHVDLDLGVMGRYINLVLGGIVREFHLEEPFDAELSCEAKTFVGTTEIEGEPCYEIHLNYGGERESETTWFVSKRDFLPRARRDVFKMQNGEKGGYFSKLTNLNVEPTVMEDAFVLKIPEGYEKTDDPAR